MFKDIYILRNLLLVCGIMLFLSCNNDSYRQMADDTMLQITIKNTAPAIKTRATEDLNDDGTITQEEIIVDGRKMYSLALFLFDGSRLVYSTVLEADDERFGNNSTEATVNIYNLDYSRIYKLYAVANYGNYGNLTGNLANVTAENITTGLSVTASTDNICNSNIAYPLSLTKEVSLTPGKNSVSGELLRTYARMRINVRNQSSLNDLYITDLSFGTKFTQRSADLFVEGGAAEVSPEVASAGAITPFEQNMVIPKMAASGAVSEKTIFDTYLLESTGGNYNYTLGLKYEGGSEEVYNVDNTAIRNANNIVDGEMYVIYYANSGRYLYANGNRVSAGTSYLTDGHLNHNYVWKFRRTDANNYTIESMGETGYYMQSSQISSSSLPLTVNPGSSDYFTASTSSNNIRLRSTRYNYYVAVNASSVYGSNSSSSSTQRRYNLYLYKVKKEEVVTDVTYSEEIPIKVVDKNSGAALPLTAIRRNDFIDILVNVTYNEKTGDVEFKVSDWENVNGDVTFN